MPAGHFRRGEERHQGELHCATPSPAPTSPPTYRWHPIPPCPRRCYTSLGLYSFREYVLGLGKEDPLPFAVGICTLDDGSLQDFGLNTPMEKDLSFLLYPTEPYATFSISKTGMDGVGNFTFQVHEGHPGLYGFTIEVDGVKHSLFRRGASSTSYRLKSPPPRQGTLPLPFHRACYRSYHVLHCLPAAKHQCDHGAVSLARDRILYICRRDRQPLFKQNRRTVCDCSSHPLPEGDVGQWDCFTPRRPIVRMSWRSGRWLMDIAGRCAD